MENKCKQVKNHVSKSYTFTNEAGCSRERKAKRARTFDPASSSAADQHDAASSQMALSNAKRAKHAKQGTALLPCNCTCTCDCTYDPAALLSCVCFSPRKGDTKAIPPEKPTLKLADFAEGPFTLLVIRIKFL